MAVTCPFPFPDGLHGLAHHHHGPSTRPPPYRRSHSTWNGYPSNQHVNNTLHQTSEWGPTIAGRCCITQASPKHHHLITNIISPTLIVDPHLHGPIWTICTLNSSVERNVPRPDIRLLIIAPELPGLTPARRPSDASEMRLCVRFTCIMYTRMTLRTLGVSALSCPLFV